MQEIVEYNEIWGWFCLCVLIFFFFNLFVI